MRIRITSRILILLSLSLLVVSISCTPSPPDQEISEQRIGDNVLILTGGGGNVTAVSTGECVVTIDTFLTPASARKARELIHNLSDKPIRYVINTHFHADHTFGNQVFSDAFIIGFQHYVERVHNRYGENLIESIEAEISELEQLLKAAQPGSEAAKEIEERLSQSRLELEDFADFVLTPPHLSLEGDATLKLGNATFEIFYFGPGHSDTDLVILVPEEKLLVMGDLFLPKRIPYIDTEAGADPENWIAIMDSVIAMSDRYEYVVPGHGDVGTVEDMKEQRDCLEDLWDAFSDAYKRGLTLEEAKEEIKLNRYEDYINFERGRPLNIENCWRYLEMNTNR